jgi:hypothetical protein
MASRSIEVTEAENPISLLAYEFVPDRAGAGKFRGGVPFLRDYRFNEVEGTLQVRSDRRDHRPFGLYGGSPGAPSANWLNPDGENRALPGKFTMTVRRGDVLRHVLAGAGGWGDPLEGGWCERLRRHWMELPLGPVLYPLGVRGDGLERVAARLPAEVHCRGELRRQRPQGILLAVGLNDFGNHRNMGLNMNSVILAVMDKLLNSLAKISVFKVGNIEVHNATRAFVSNKEINLLISNTRNASHNCTKGVLFALFVKKRIKLHKLF